MKNRNFHHVQASFTLEAVLLMGIILPVLMALCYLSLYDHDRGVLLGAACEISAMADSQLPGSRSSSGLKSSASSLGNSSMIGSGELKTSCSVSEDSVSVSYRSSIALPGFVLNLFGRNSLQISESCERQLLKPGRIIRKMKGLRYLEESAKGEKHAAKAGGS